MTDPKREPLEGASTVLVLAPITPDGNHDYLEFVASTPVADTSLASVTYTQPPAQWLDDWRRTNGALPRETHIIHASGLAHADPDGEVPFDRVTADVVDPTDPMAIIPPLSRRLEAWADGDTQPVISVQTLTVLLEYVDFDTAFRYLHILTHRIQAAGALGFFQMDPNIHDPETTNTLTSLFDVVVERSAESGEWRTIPAVSSRTDMDTVAPSAPTNATESTKRSGDNRLSSLRTTLSRLFGRDASNGDSSKPEPIEEPPTAPLPHEPEEEQTPIGNLVDEELLTDEERIRSLLTQSGGRMKQADITAATSWSKSTVSRKLAQMEADGEITRVQIGQGNIVFLNGSEPKATKSPFDV
ncbi:helix-turn-helix transcriptional regulator [Haladaptatus sp. NG-SE-30]